MCGENYLKLEKTFLSGKGNSTDQRNVDSKRDTVEQIYSMQYKETS